MVQTLSATSPAGENNTLRGVAFMVAATIIFAAQDGFSKALADNHSAVFVTMWRYWAFGTVCLFMLWRTGFRAGLASGQPRLQIARGVILALEICVAIAAFALLGLAASHAIFAFMPLLVVALSGPVLGEKVGWRRWTAVGVGLIGMMLIIRPGTRALTPELGIAIVAFTVACGVVSSVFDRPVSRFEVVVEDEIFLVTAFSIFINQEHAGIQVEVMPGSDASIPAKANPNFLDARRFLGQRDVGAFGK